MWASACSAHLPGLVFDCCVEAYCSCLRSVKVRKEFLTPLGISTYFKKVQWDLSWAFFCFLGKVLLYMLPLGMCVLESHPDKESLPFMLVIPVQCSGLMEQLKNF